MVQFKQLSHKGGMLVKQIQEWTPENRTINILLWGKEGVGKTYLVSSMPKKCLYLTFDPNALNGINDLIVSGRINKEDVPYLAFDDGDYKEVAMAYKNPRDPFGLEEIYQKTPFNTLVIDSLTAWFKLALTYAIELSRTFGLKEQPTIERPQLVGYGIRSTATKEMAFNVINWCRKHNVNCVFIAHKGEMSKDEQTGMMYNSIGLSGDIPNEIARWCDECWMLGVDGVGKRLMQVQPLANARPLKTRMFDTSVGTIDVTNFNLSDLIDVWHQVGKINSSTLTDLLKG